MRCKWSDGSHPNFQDEKTCLSNPCFPFHLREASSDGLRTYRVCCFDERGDCSSQFITTFLADDDDRRGGNPTITSTTTSIFFITSSNGIRKTTLGTYDCTYDVVFSRTEVGATSLSTECRSQRSTDLAAPLRHVKNLILTEGNQIKRDNIRWYTPSVSSTCVLYYGYTICGLQLGMKEAKKSKVSSDDWRTKSIWSATRYLEALLTWSSKFELRLEIFASMIPFD